MPKKEEVKVVPEVEKKQTQNGDKLKIDVSNKQKPDKVKVETAQTNAPGAQAISSRPARILVTDDSDETRLMVTKIIQKMSKWETLEARDGEEALKIIQTDKPDLLVLDIMMPNMDGYEVLQEIKSNPELENIPVLIFSALKTQKSEQKVYELGADGFIVKPIEPKRMIEQMGRVLDRKRSRGSNIYTESSSNEIDLKLV